MILNSLYTTNKIEIIFPPGMHNIPGGPIMVLDYALCIYYVTGCVCFHYFNISLYVTFKSNKELRSITLPGGIEFHIPSHKPQQANVMKVIG